MSYSFNGTTRIVQLPAGMTRLVVRDLFSRWEDWMVASDNIKYLPAFRVVGGDALPGSRSLGLTYFLLNGWRVRPSEADQELEVVGNFYTEEGVSPFIPTIGNYNVLISLTTSNLIDVITISAGSGLSPEEHDAVMASREEAAKARKMQTNKAIVSGDGLSVSLYDDDGVSLLHSFTVSADKNTRTPA